jgi:hypothetical protein
VNYQIKHYKHYEKILETNIEQSIVDTSEYQSFSELYPHIAESIRLKRKIEILTQKLKSENQRGEKFKIKRQISITKSKLRQNNLFKRLHGGKWLLVYFHHVSV